MTDHTPSRATLGDVIEAVRRANLKPRKRQDIVSAILTIAKAVGREPPAIPADLRTLNVKLRNLSGASIGISPARLSNAKSLLRAGFALCAPIMPGRSNEAISPDWLPLYQRLRTRSDRIKLSRMVRWLSGRGICPKTVTVKDLEIFRVALTDLSLTNDPEGNWVDTMRVWTRCVSEIEGWPDVVARPRQKDPHTYTLPWSAFPASLKQEADAWLRRLAGEDILDDDGPLQPLAKVTLKYQEHYLRAFVSALVLRGRKPETLTSIATCLTIDNYGEGVRFFHERFGKKPNATAHRIATTMKGLARHWLKADQATLQRMAKITQKVAVKQNGMTQKNRDRLLQFEDPVVKDRLLNLPQELRRLAQNNRTSSHRRRTLAQVAVAIELLIVTLLRIKNLAALELGHHLVRSGDRLFLTIPAEELKTKMNALDFELPMQTTELIDWSVEGRNRRPTECRYLFPGEGGGHKSISTLRRQIEETVWKHVGAKVNPHLFRHLGGELYLERNPGGYEVLRRVLGHARMETTTKYYAGRETRGAAKHFAAEIRKLRERGLPPPPKCPTKPRSRRKVGANP